MTESNKTSKRKSKASKNKVKQDKQKSQEIKRKTRQDKTRQDNKDNKETKRKKEIETLSALEFHSQDTQDLHSTIPYYSKYWIVQEIKSRRAMLMSDIFVLCTRTRNRTCNTIPILYGLFNPGMFQCTHHS